MNSGEFARLAGVTQRALRHYRQQGLLTEVAVGANGYFDYTLADLLRVLRIKNLSALGFSLAQIRAVLTEEPVDQRRMMAALDRELVAHIDALAQQREMLALLQKYDLPLSTPPHFAKLIALLEAHDYPQALLEREVAMLMVADHMLDEDTLSRLIDTYERLIASGHFAEYCAFGVALDALRTQHDEAAKTQLVAQGTALFAALIDAGLIDRQTVHGDADVDDDLDQIFRQYDGEDFYDVQLEITDRIMENLRKQFS